MKRAALIVLAAVGAGVALGQGSAGAGTADDTVVTSEPLAGGGYKLIVTAAPGQANELSTCTNAQAVCKDMFDDVYAIRDSGPGIKDDSSKCIQESDTEVRCELQGLRRVAIRTGDMPDVARTLAGELSFYIELLMGPGKDTAEVAGRASVKGSGGGDTLQGRRGNQRLLGGRGGDKITGGRGNNDTCDGQQGDDSGGAGCETEVSL